MALIRMTWTSAYVGTRVESDQPFRDSVFAHDPHSFQRRKMWEKEAAESYRNRVHFGYVEGAVCECHECNESRGVNTEPVTPPEPVKPKSRKRKSRKQGPPESPQSKAWSSLHEIRDHLRAERGDILTD